MILNGKNVVNVHILDKQRLKALRAIELRTKLKKQRHDKILNLVKWEVI